MRMTGSIRAIKIVTFIFILVACSLTLRQGQAKTMFPVIVVHAKQFAFIPSQITLKAGKTVRLVFISEDVTHSITIPGLKIDMPIQRGYPAIIVITPTAKGNFPGRCTHYCGIGHDRMKFMVHVK